MWCTSSYSPCSSGPVSALLGTHQVCGSEWNTLGGTCSGCNIEHWREGTHKHTHACTHRPSGLTHRSPEPFSSASTPPLPSQCQPHTVISWHPSWESTGEHSPHIHDLIIHEMPRKTVTNMLVTVREQEIVNIILLII